MVREKLSCENARQGVDGMANRFVQVLEIASRRKADVRPFTRPSLAEEFFRENPMPWLLDADPVDEPPSERQSA